jgi:hypothetical protein
MEVDTEPMQRPRIACTWSLDRTVDPFPRLVHRVSSLARISTFTCTYLYMESHRDVRLLQLKFFF